MFQQAARRTALVLCALTATPTLADTHTWTDAKSGREYLLLDAELTHAEAESACFEQGYALSDLRYVNDDERKDLLANALLDKLAWETLYTGTSRETHIAKIWQGARQATFFTSGAVQLVIQKRGGKTTTAEEWHGNSDTGRALCMSVDAFWYLCTVHNRCTFTSAGTEYSTDTSFSDYGATESEAMRRNIERIQDPSVGAGGKCSIPPNSQNCLRMLP